MMFKKLEVKYISWIKRQPKGIIAGAIKAVLHVISFGYRLITSCRNWLFDNGWFRQYSPPVPVVISVGNIVAGGAGKTPVTTLLAEEFYSEFPMAILSRGYRSQAEKLPLPVVVSRGKGPLHPASYCGDEPYLLANAFPKAYVFSGPNRQKASNMAAEEGVQVIVIDDGMQHRSLARDFEIVVMDSYDPFGQGYFLPRGFLREGASSLSRADLIVLNNAENDTRFASLLKQVSQYSTAPVVRAKVEVTKICDLEGEPIESLEGKRVGIFCGIGSPERFEQTVAELGAEVVSRCFLSDHLAMSQEKLKRFSRRSKEQGAELLVCTEKDQVKLPPGCESELPVIWVQMRLVLLEGSMAWQQLIEKAKRNLELRS